MTRPGPLLLAALLAGACHRPPPCPVERYECDVDADCAALAANGVDVDQVYCDTNPPWPDGTPNGECSSASGAVRGQCQIRKLVGASCSRDEECCTKSCGDDAALTCDGPSPAHPDTCGQPWVIGG